jgi:hypothetical protein
MTNRNIRKPLITAVLISLPLFVADRVFTLRVQASLDQIECESNSRHVKAVTSQDYHFTTAVFNFPSDGQGHFDSYPLLSTTIEVGRPGPSCLIAHFSAMGDPLDNHVVFQVRVDGVPMQGHLSGFVGIATPVVADPEETDMNLPRMVAYNFFAQVQPGVHSVDVLFAGCCSAAPPPGLTVAQVGSPVLTLEYVGTGN